MLELVAQSPEIPASLVSDSLTVVGSHDGGDAVANSPILGALLWTSSVSHVAVVVTILAPPLFVLPHADSYGPGEVEPLWLVEICATRALGVSVAATLIGHSLRELR